MAFIRLTFVPFGGGGGSGGIPYTVFNAKGDILVGTGPDAAATLPVGADGSVLLADSAQPDGVRWGNVPGTGDVVGPASSLNNTAVAFDGLTGKLIKDSGIPAALFVVDSGAGGAAGFVPAPPAGSAANSYVLQAGVGWAQLNEDQILPGFDIASFAKTAPNGATLLYLRGTALTGPNTTVAATYVSTYVPDSAALVNTLGGSTDIVNDVPPVAWPFVTPFASSVQPAAVARFGTDAGADPTWTITLNATKSPASTKTRSITITWTRQVFWGPSGAFGAGPLTNLQVVGLANNVLSTSKSRTVTVTLAGEYFYYAFPNTYGTVTMKDAVTGFAISTQDYTVAGVSSGISSTYRVYRSIQALTGTFTIQVT